MKEKPILFSSEMVKAILDGRKTMARRVVRFPGHPMIGGVTGQVQEHHEMKAVYAMPRGGFVFWSGDPGKEFSDYVYKDSDDGLRCPYGQPGDRLWVRETFKGAWKKNGRASEYWLTYRADNKKVLYRTAYIDDFENWPNKWRPSIFMPRWASRITLEIVSVRVERINQITEEDARAEGAPTLTAVAQGGKQSHQLGFMVLWNDINGKRGFGFDVNPWVWVIEFKKVGA